MQTNKQPIVNSLSDLFRKLFGRTNQRAVVSVDQFLYNRSYGGKNEKLTLIIAIHGKHG